MCVSSGGSCTASSTSVRRAASSPSPAATKSLPVKQTVDRGVGPTPAPPSPRDQLQLYLGAVPPAYLRDPRQASFIDATLGQSVCQSATYIPLFYPRTFSP